MAIQLPDNIFVATNAPLDVRYGPYVAADITAARTLIDSTVSLGNRYEGLTVGIILGSAPDPVVEYWFYGGVDITNLVEKSSGGGGDIIVLNQTGPTGTPSQLTGAYEKFNFVNYDPNDLRVFAQEDPNDADQVNIFFPPPASPTYPPYFNETGAIVADPINSLRKTLRISDPSTNGNFDTGGWTGLERSAYLLSSATELQFKPGSNVYILGFSPAGAPTATGCKVQVKVYDADGVTLLRNETTGVLDGNTTFGQNQIEVTVSNYAAIVDPYGDPTQYQAKLNIKIKIEDILNSVPRVGGRFSAEIIFTPDQVLPEPGTNPGTPKTAITYSFADVFADADPTSPDTTSVTFGPTAPQSTQIYSYLSGVKYLTAGSKFGISSKFIQGINGNTQGKNGSAANNLAFTALSGMNTLGVSDKAWSPTNGNVSGWNDNWDKIAIKYDYDDFTIQSNAYTYRGAAGGSTLTISDPWNDATRASANNLDVLILTPGGTNPSDLTEYFNNESKRLSKASLTANYNNWNSQTALSTLEFGTKPNAATNSDFQDACQIVDGFSNNGAELISANTFDLSNGNTQLDFSTGYLPSQNTNFSTFNKPSVYHRQFGNGASTGFPFASFSLTFTGSNWGTGNSNINDALNNQDIKIYIRRVASNSGASFGANTAVPLNLHNWNSTPSNPNRYWSPGAFNDGGSGIDTHSATIRASTSSGNSVQATFGSFSADIGIFVEIQYLEPNIKINSITCALNF